MDVPVGRHSVFKRKHHRSSEVSHTVSDTAHSRCWEIAVLTRSDLRQTATPSAVFPRVMPSFPAVSSGPVLLLGSDTEYQAYTLKTGMREDLQNQWLCPAEMAKLIGEYWRSLEPAERKIYEDQAIATKT